VTSRSDLYIGIMSGTSLDGIDVAVCRFGSKAELVHFHSTDWRAGIREILMTLATQHEVDFDLFSRTHFLLAQEYARAISETLESAALKARDIRAVGLHGQTVRHLPKPETVVAGLPPVAATFQMGSGSALAALSNIDVVSDFRSADVALGGQGAPLVPMFDYEFLRSDSVDRVILNIGGIANITWLPKNARPDDVIAFDSGPGNMLIDSLAKKYFARGFDKDGEIARSGKIDNTLLEQFLSDPYFKLSPPKSTGRELFSENFLAIVYQKISEGSLRKEDALATVTEFTARSIVESLNLIGATDKRIEVIVSGGGAMNAYLMDRLNEKAPFARIVSSDAFGIPSKAKEAIAFAYFAKAFVEGIVIHLPKTTGATQRVMLGSLSRAM